MNANRQFLSRWVVQAAVMVGVSSLFLTACADLKTIERTAGVKGDVERRDVINIDSSTSLTKKEVDIILTIDNSGSMGDKIAKTIQSIEGMVSQLNGVAANIYVYSSTTLGGYTYTRPNLTYTLYLWHTTDDIGTPRVPFDTRYTNGTASVVGNNSNPSATTTPVWTYLNNGVRETKVNAYDIPQIWSNGVLSPIEFSTILSLRYRSLTPGGNPITISANANTSEIQAVTSALAGTIRPLTDVDGNPQEAMVVPSLMQMRDGTLSGTSAAFIKIADQNPTYLNETASNDTSSAGYLTRELTMAQSQTSSWRATRESAQDTPSSRYTGTITRIQIEAKCERSNGDGGHVVYDSKPIYTTCQANDDARRICLHNEDGTFTDGASATYPAPCTADQKDAIANVWLKCRDGVMETCNTIARNTFRANYDIDGADPTVDHRTNPVTVNGVTYTDIYDYIRQVGNRTPAIGDWTFTPGYDTPVRTFRYVDQKYTYPSAAIEAASQSRDVAQLNNAYNAEFHRLAASKYSDYFVGVVGYGQDVNGSAPCPANGANTTTGLFDLANAAPNKHISSVCDANYNDMMQRITQFANSTAPVLTYALAGWVPSTDEVVKIEVNGVSIPFGAGEAIRVNEGSLPATILIADKAQVEQLSSADLDAGNVSIKVTRQR